MNKKAYRGRIITWTDKGNILDTEGYLLVKNGKIIGISNGSPDVDEVIDFEDHLILPGFVDTHIHLPQVRIRGRWMPNLLDWLEKYVFPEEKKFLDPEYAEKNAEYFFKKLAMNGTTTAMVYGPPGMEATDAAFKSAKRSGLNVLMGQTLMDQNVPEELMTGVEDAKRAIRAMHEKWSGEGLQYVLTIRFAPACSMELMRETGKIARELGIRIQTHISEQRDEVELVRRMYGMNYADVYDKAGLLTPRTVLAHAIHLSDEELNLLSKRKVKIAHCPSSNFFLHSGVMPISRIEEFSLEVGLGSDVAAGPYFNMLEVCRDACYANPISPEKAFYLATLGGARVLGLDNRLGSLEQGKDADFVVLDIQGEDTRDVLSKAVFLGHSGRVMATYSRGREVWVQ